MEAGDADKETVGAGVGGELPTVTEVLWFAEPPVPVQLRVYVALAVGETDCVPLVFCEPLQPPLAVQEVALVELQLIVED